MPVLAVAMLAGAIVFLATPQRASAAVTDYRPATYNMQGGGNKWTTDIPQLTNRGYNVISLQEAGPRPPASATLLWTSGYLSGNQQWAGWRVQQYRWRPLGQSQDWYIYFVRTDFGGNRVNLAILTRQAAHEVHIARPAFYGSNGLPTSRPALGITLGSTIFFSVHALASGGTDGRQLLQNMAGLAGSRIWAAMGDWNRAPSTLQVQPGWHRYTVNGPTHQSGGELDYMVSNQRIAGYGAAARGYGSDHFAVMFSVLRANAGVALFNAHDGNRALEVESQNATTTGSSIVSMNKQPGPWGHFKFVPEGDGNYSIRVTKRPAGTPEMCLDAGDARLRRYPCDGSIAQLFDMQYWGDTGQLKIVSVDQESCLGDDTDNGYGTELVTTVTCTKGEARFNFRFDQDPDPNAAAVVF
ncbi:endonuclease/exonuclease/phosphatase family protein [Streptomyces sp. GbtcB7]|uniref:endonuclease/exonuclease/phosphatase family protein n=1 Tax=Streptomyces sp. GbtcB7 TaxID=2824752 RepID=UPI001C30BD18|nr:endonuclease/exonuclease/phosphatase family protein [Streptomyces sp. GbtcB7]